MLTIVLAVRRLPYGLRAAAAALQQEHRSLEEAAENLGAGKTVTLARIVVPLMADGLAAAFVTSFATAAVELSATLVLVTRDVDAPLSYGIYICMQSAAGRGPGAALSRAHDEIDGIVGDQRAEAAGDAARLQQRGLGGQGAGTPGCHGAMPRDRPAGRGPMLPPGAVTSASTWTL